MLEQDLPSNPTKEFKLSKSKKNDIQEASGVESKNETEMV